MTRVRFPLVDVVVGVGETPTLGAPVLEPHGLFISLWNDESATTPADVTSDEAGTDPITGVVIQSTRIPPFWAPDGTVQLWGRVDAYNEMLLFLPTDPAAGSRDAAAASAAAAGVSATSAASSATTASTGAGTATSEAGLAATARTGAETARTGAETAQTGAAGSATAAQTARTGAETARTGAETARDAAAGSATASATSAAASAASASSYGTELATHEADHNNPHVVTKTQIGLGSVDNTSDLAKPVSTAQAAAISTAIANLVNGAPGALDTLNELATQLGSDENAAAALTTLVTGIRNLTDATHSTALNNAFAGKGDPARSPRVLPPVAPAKGAISTFQSGHGWTGTGFATVADDTTDYEFGVQSAKLVTDTAGTSATFDSPVLTAIDLTKRELRFRLKIDGIANLADLRVYGGNATLSNAKNITIKPTELAGSDFQFVKEGEWSWFTISWDAGSDIGTPVKTAITKFRVRVQANNGTAVTVHLGGFFTQKQEYAAAFPYGVISSTYDDGRVTGYVAGRAALEKYGWAGTFYPIRDRLNLGAPYVTTAQLLAAQAVGHEIGVHADTGANHNAGFTTLPTDTVETGEFLAERDWFYTNGFGDVSGMAWPRGMSNAAVETAARKVVSYGRGIYTASGNTRETLPPANPMRLRALSVGASTTLSTLQTFVDKCVSQGDWGILVFHEVRPTLLNDGAPECLQSVHDGIFDYIAGLTNKPAVLPVMDVFRRMPSPELVDVPLGGDLSGTLTVGTVAKINGAAVSGTPDTGKVLTGVGGTAASWQPLSGVDAFTVNNRIAAGEGTFPRMLAAGSQATSSQNLLLTYFTAEVTETITQIALGTASIAAAATPTLVRAGIYSVDPSTGDMALIVSTANDTTLFAAINTKYAKPLSGSWSKVAGTRYALGLLVVSSATMPNYPGISMLGPTNFATDAPKLAAAVSAQADLPSTISGSGLGSSKFMVYAELLR